MSHNIHINYISYVNKADDNIIVILIIIKADFNKELSF